MNFARFNQTREGFLLYSPKGESLALRIASMFFLSQLQTRKEREAYMAWFVGGKGAWRGGWRVMESNGVEVKIFVVEI